MELKNIKNFNKAVSALTKRYARTTNPFIYESLSDYIDVIFRKTKNVLLTQFNIEIIRTQDGFSSLQKYVEVDELDIEKYKPDLLPLKKQLDSSIIDINNKLEKLYIELHSALTNKDMITKEVEKLKKIELMEYERALEMERKEIEEYKRENRCNSSSNTNSYGRLERR